MFVYKINTELTKNEAEELYKNLTFQEIEDLEGYDMKAYDVEINGKMSSYVITTRYVLTRIILFFRQKNLDFTYEDITDDVLFSQIKFHDDDFNKNIDDFINENITVDHILDKINQFGIESLTDSDRKKLENN
jgi:hypothetical protein